MVKCSSAKKGYYSRATAMRQARREMGQHGRVILRVYSCEECKQWHLTSTPNHPSQQLLKYRQMRREPLL
jgi:hypothetical protein